MPSSRDGATELRFLLFEGGVYICILCCGGLSLIFFFFSPINLSLHKRERQGVGE